MRNLSGIIETSRGLEPPPSGRRFVQLDINPLSRRRKHRILYEPNASMRAVHDQLLPYLRAQIRHLRASGRIRGPGPRSWQGNAVAHREHQYFYLTDLKNAFPSVKPNWLIWVLNEIESGLDEEELTWFVTTCLANVEDGLIQGFPASNVLFDLVAGMSLDTALTDYLCAQRPITYTRYTDDLTFSSHRPFTKEERREIRSRITDAGFCVNHRKSEVVDLQTKRRIVITGVGLAYGGRVFLSREYRRKLSGMLIRSMVNDDVNLLRIQGYWALYRSIRKAAGPGQRRTASEYRLECLYDRWRTEHLPFSSLNRSP